MSTNPSSPYNVGIAPVPINNSLNTAAQMKKYKEEEETTYKAPQILPFDFNATEELISKLYEDLTLFRIMLEKAKQNPQVKSKNIDPILGVIDNIGVQILQTIPELLDKLKI